MDDKQWQEQEDEIRKQVRINTYSQGYEKTRENLLQNAFALDKQMFYLSSGIIIASLYIWSDVAKLYSICLFGKLFNLLLLLLPIASAMWCFWLNMNVYRSNTKTLNFDLSLHMNYILNRGEDERRKVEEDRLLYKKGAENLFNSAWFWLKVSIFTCIMSFSVLYLVNNKISEEEDKNLICSFDMFGFKTKDKKPQKPTTKGDYVGEHLIAYGSSEPAMPMVFNVRKPNNKNNKNNDANNKADKKSI